jgi:hypothetical protein
MFPIFHIVFSRHCQLRLRADPARKSAGVFAFGSNPASARTEWHARANFASVPDHAEGSGSASSECLMLARGKRRLITGNPPASLPEGTFHARPPRVLY